MVWISPDPGVVNEIDKLHEYLKGINLRDNSTLRALAEYQCEGLVKFRHITELDFRGRSFIERLKTLGFDPKVQPFTEFYFIIDFPIKFDFYDMMAEARKMGFTDYGCSVKKYGGFYYIVVTLGDFNVYV